MAVGAKLNETRSWPTRYRGPLAICAAKFRGQLGDVQAFWLWEYRKQLGPSCGNVTELFDELPRGAVLCVVDLDDCIPTSHASLGLSIVERDLGNYQPGRFAWMTSNCRALREPMPVIGRQGLFNLDVPEKLFSPAAGDRPDRIP